MRHHNQHGLYSSLGWTSAMTWTQKAALICRVVYLFVCESKPQLFVETNCKNWAKNLMPGSLYLSHPMTQISRPPGPIQWLLKSTNPWCQAATNICSWHSRNSLGAISIKRPINPLRNCLAVRLIPDKSWLVTRFKSHNCIRTCLYKIYKILWLFLGIFNLYQATAWWWVSGHMTRVLAFELPFDGTIESSNRNLWSEVRSMKLNNLLLLAVSWRKIIWDFSCCGWRNLWVPCWNKSLVSQSLQNQADSKMVLRHANARSIKNKWILQYCLSLCFSAHEMQPYSRYK